VKRVVITGVGILSPLGRGLIANWDEGLMKSRSGIVKNMRFDTAEYPSKVCGAVPYGTGEFDFDMDGIASADRRKMDDFILYAVEAADQAMTDAGLSMPESMTDDEREMAGVYIGSGIGGIGTIERGAPILKNEGLRRLSPFFIPACLSNLGAGHVSIKYGLKGPNLTVSTACATGTHAIGEASRIIRCGEATVMVAGGAEAGITPLGVAGFSAARTLSTAFNDTPEKASRPWNKDRDGFVIGDGAGIVVLEEYEHAVARGAKIYAEVVGYGTSADAYHITTPADGGEGGYRAMKAALKNAGLTPDDIGYINAHGTSTGAGDLREFQAVRKLFGRGESQDLSHMCMSSTKSAIGHLLGAAGAVEAIYSAMALKTGMLPPTLNLDDPEDEVVASKIDLIPHNAKAKQVEYAISNSFGFGGTNSSLILKKV
jgi:3-oxoacyl-[acyl-carrier-protein] synthase II